MPPGSLKSTELKRHIMTKTMKLMAGLTLSVAFSGVAVHADEAAGIAPTRSLQLLMNGNKRYTSGTARHDHQDASTRNSLIKSQHPFAVIVGCSDSRVPGEIIFDQGLGDLFSVRTAGEVQGDASVGSIEYAVEHLGTQLVVVLGHESCGAVDAAIKGGHAPGHIGSLIEAIEPAVKSVKTKPGSLLDNAVTANVKMVVSQLRSDALLRERIETGKLRVVGARYDLHTGVVTIIPVSNADMKVWKTTSNAKPALARR